MTSNQKYQEYIIPKLQEFWNEHQEDYVNSGLTDGLFLPHVMKEYDTSDKKIFYIGQDAPYWLSADKMAELFNKGNYSEYIEENNKVMRLLESRLAWGNSPSAFWTMVNKLHIYLMTGEWKQDIAKLTSREMSLLNSVGYGNVNCIPLKHTIENYGSWDDVNPDLYIKIRKALFPIEQLKGIISVFEPDIIIILTSHVNYFIEENLFNNLDISWLSMIYESGPHISAGTIYNGKKKCQIAWASNPNRYRFIATNMYEVSSKIKEALRLE